MKLLSKKPETATFAMGCFWQPDYIFSKIKGVIKKRVGYTGCNAACKNPTYEQVCSNTSGCAEAIEIIFNAKIISYNELLDLFWKNHDPTQMNQQGPDIGTQYRSAIFYHSPEQKKQAQVSKKRWEKRLKNKTMQIVTEITKATPFYSAEDYHQEYLQKTDRSCHISISPFM